MLIKSNNIINTFLALLFVSPFFGGHITRTFQMAALLFDGL